MDCINFTVLKNGGYENIKDKAEQLIGLWAVYEYKNNVYTGIINSANYDTEDVQNTSVICVADAEKLDKVTYFRDINMKDVITLYYNKKDCLQYKGITK